MTVFTKSRANAPDKFFEAEAAGLKWLQDSHGARVVNVIEVGPGRIVLERLERAQPTPQAAREFGAALATTHAAGAASFGAPPDGWEGPLYIGNRELPHVTSDSWGKFYAHGRVLPYLAPAVQAGFLHDDEAAVVREACDAVASGIFDGDSPPARIHGDLWTGNVMFTPEGAVIIDPAAHGGHHETDLAMLALFGAPFLDRIIEGYQTVTPLDDGWDRRIAVHQLHPLAVHAAGHARSYGLELTHAARKVLDLV